MSGATDGRNMGRNEIGVVGGSGRGTVPVIPNNPTRKAFHPFDDLAYRKRNLIERMFCRLKDWRRIATRYHKLAAHFAAAVALAAVIIWWT
jgi:putative transposase